MESLVPMQIQSGIGQLVRWLQMLLNCHTSQADGYKLLIQHSLLKLS
jgi:hypothetical protein